MSVRAAKSVGRRSALKRLTTLYARRLNDIPNRAERQRLAEALVIACAYHEAGHAVAQLTVRHEVPRFVTIVPVGDEWGSVHASDWWFSHGDEATKGTRAARRRNQRLVTSAEISVITALAGPIVPNLHVLARVSLPELLEREANPEVGSGDVPEADRILGAFEGNMTRRAKWLLELAVRTEETLQQKEQTALIHRIVEALLDKPSLSRDDLCAIW